jgi:hypothetical protein
MRVRECQLCRKRSVPYFGFYLPCPYDTMGRHRSIIEVEESDEETSKRLQRAYCEVPSYDRRSFDHNAPQEIRALLKLREPH